MYFLVEKYVPSSKNQHTVGNRGDKTPKLPPSGEGTLPIAEATEKVDSPILEAETMASTGAAEELKHLSLEREPGPPTGVTERPKYPSLEDGLGDAETSLSGLKLASDEPNMRGRGLEPGIQIAGQTGSISIMETDGTEAKAVSSHIEHAYEPPGSVH